MHHTQLIPDVIHVVRFRLDEPLTGFDAVLDERERERANRFIRECDRRRFIRAHALMRHVLGRFTGCAPHVLRFTAGAYGKPRLADASIDIQFNLSHAGERALLAVALGRQVGVDVEHTDALTPTAFADLPSRWLAPGEAHALRRLPAALQPHAFVRCWTRKEAFVKALGRGLTYPLRRFEVSVTSDHSPQLLLACDDDPSAIHKWRIVSVPMESGYAAALAASVGHWRIVSWRYAIGESQSGRARRSSL